MTSEHSSEKNNSIDIYTDGSCLGNPGIGGWGAIIQYMGAEKVLRGGDADTTNNRMEMTAIISALDWVKKNIISKTSDSKKNIPVKIFSDSNLIIQTLLQNWKRKKNTDLWSQLDEAAQDLNITWCWVKAHANNVMNNRVDKVAVSESLKIKSKKP